MNVLVHCDVQRNAGSAFRCTQRKTRHYSAVGSQGSRGLQDLMRHLDL